METISKLNHREKRLLIQTTDAIYLLKGGDCTSKKIIELKYVVRSKSDQSREVLLCFLDDTDLRLRIESQDELD